MHIWFFSTSARWYHILKEFPSLRRFPLQNQGFQVKSYHKVLKGGIDFPWEKYMESQDHHCSIIFPLSKFCPNYLLKSRGGGSVFLVKLRGTLPLLGEQMVWLGWRAKWTLTVSQPLSPYATFLSTRKFQWGIFWRLVRWGGYWEMSRGEDHKQKKKVLELRIQYKIHKGPQDSIFLVGSK